MFVDWSIKKMNKRRHYHVMNGSIGCLPDNNQVYRTKRDALDYARFLFDDICEPYIGDLKYYGIHYFSDYGMAGADYIEIIDCYDPDCLIDLDY